MAAPSPASTSAEPSGPVSPPSYPSTPAPQALKTDPKSDEKIAYEKPIPEEGIEPVPNPNDGDNLPEVVPEGHAYHSNSFNEKPTPNQTPGLDSKSAMRSADDVREQLQTPPPPGYNGHQMMSMAPPANPSNGNFPPPIESDTVTPLYLLGDQSDTVDCPFCRRRTTTLIQKSPSWLTHVVAMCLFFVSVCGVVAPYMLHWSSHISHYCQNCSRKVAYRNYGSSKVVALGTPDHLREVSKFQPAEPKAPGMNPQAVQQA